MNVYGGQRITSVPFLTSIHYLGLLLLLRWGSLIDVKLPSRLGWPVNPRDPPVSASISTEIVSMDHCAQHFFKKKKGEGGSWRIEFRSLCFQVSCQLSIQSPILKIINSWTWGHFVSNIKSILTEPNSRCFGL